MNRTLAFRLLLCGRDANILAGQGVRDKLTKLERFQYNDCLPSQSIDYASLQKQ